MQELRERNAERTQSFVEDVCAGDAMTLFEDIIKWRHDLENEIPCSIDIVQLERALTLADIKAKELMLLYEEAGDVVIEKREALSDETGDLHFSTHIMKPHKNNCTKSIAERN